LPGTTKDSLRVWTTRA